MLYCIKKKTHYFSILSEQNTINYFMLLYFFISCVSDILSEYFYLEKAEYVW